MIRSTQNFIDYFSGVRRRTLHFASGIPTDHLDWSPKDGEFTCADLLRHIAASEKLFVGVVAEGRWKYGGHGGDQGSLDELIALLDRTHEESMRLLGGLPDAELDQPRPSLVADRPLKVWRWLMIMSEHEIHHRSQLAVYLTLLGVTSPHIFGLGVEDIIARAVG
jgi:uncharacterized damage-inducible protein DinB